MDREKIIRIIDELIFEAQKAPTWKAENALRCLKKELLKEQEAVVRCKECKHGIDLHNGLYECVCEYSNSPYGTCHVGEWFCYDGEQKEQK